MNVSVDSSRKVLRFSAYSAIVVMRMTFPPRSRRNHRPEARQTSSTAVSATTLRRKIDTSFPLAASETEMLTPAWSATRRMRRPIGTFSLSRYRRNSDGGFVGAASGA